MTKINVLCTTVLAMALTGLTVSGALAQTTDDATGAASEAGGAASDAAGTAADGAADAAGTAPESSNPDADSVDQSLPDVDVVQDQVQQPKKRKPRAKKKIAKKKKPQPQPDTQFVPAPAPEPDFAEAPIDQSLSEARASGEVAQTSPFPGSEISVDKIPGSVSTVSAADLERDRDAKPIEALQKNVPGAIVTDTAGSSYRSQIEYRGFASGPVTGFPQGLAVYQNGVRINEVFGDVVYWDVLPSNAINDITVVTGNPAFGLNAIGGAITVQMKDGFDFQGVEIDFMAGSFSRRQIGAQVGAKSGNFAAYFAGQYIEDDQFRDFSEVEIRRGYADLGAKGSKVEAHINLTWADNKIGQVASSPRQILDLGINRTFTNPQTTAIDVLMPSFNLSAKVNDTLTVSGLAYYRRFTSNVVDGNLLDAEGCLDDGSGVGGIAGDGVGEVDAGGDLLPGDNLCDEEEGELLENLFGNPIDAGPGGLDLDDPFGVIDRIDQKARSWGFGLQLVEKARLLGMKNQFTAGISYDRGRVNYKTASELGEIGPRFVVTGSGATIAGPDDFIGRNVDADTSYFGIYFSNTLDVTDQLALTIGGRYNYAKIDLLDLTGEFDGITSNHKFTRFNPSIGATYKVVPGLSVYGGYSEANRAPTPAELACANPEVPCPIESFLTDDPPLEQVVTRTFELGVRGKWNSASGNQRMNWGVGLFHSASEDDIIFLTAAQSQGRGFFLNAGETQRQGIEAHVKYKTGPWAFYANYSYIRATYESAFQVSSPAHPFAIACDGADPGDDPACINVSKGDFIPGIPQHRFKAGFDVNITPQWKVGADLVAASGQYHLTDDANLLGKIAGYSRVDVRTSYDVNKNIQLYGFVNNVFDARYGLFGNLFGEEASEVIEEIEGFPLTDVRGLTPAAPVAVYGGIKFKY